MYPFVFNPFGRNNTVNILDLVIPKVKTIALGESTENVVLGICPKVWCRLPKEGVIVLEVRHTAEASGASLPVFISVSGSVSTASNTHNIPSVSEDKTMMTDSNIGLTIATEKSQIVNMVKQSLEDCRIKKESLSKIDEEMRRCEDILKILNVNSDITTNVTKDFKELDELRAEVKELKQLLQNISTVRPEENNIDPPTEEKENEI